MYMYLKCYGHDRVSWLWGVQCPPPPCTGLSRMERVRPRLLPGVPVARKYSKQILNVHTYLI